MRVESRDISREQKNQVLRYANHLGKTLLCVRFSALSLEKHPHSSKMGGTTPVGLLDANGCMPTLTNQAALGRKLESVNFSLCHKIFLTGRPVDCVTGPVRSGVANA